MNETPDADDARLPLEEVLEVIVDLFLTNEGRRLGQVLVDLDEIAVKLGAKSRDPVLLAPYRSVARHCVEALAQMRMLDDADGHLLFEVVDEQALSNDEATLLLELRLAKEARPIFEAREAGRESVMEAWRKVLIRSGRII